MKVNEVDKDALPAFCITDGDKIEITLQIDRIIIKKPVCGCVFCGAAANLVGVGHVYACCNCIERLHNAREGDTLYPVNVE